jgi:hypothetical protein
MAGRAPQAGAPTVSTVRGRRRSGLLHPTDRARLFGPNEVRALAPLLLVFTLAGCAIRDRPPHAFLPPIAEEYYVCAKCGSLDGGIYGKGPLAHFRSAGAATCRHQWMQITFADFKRQAQTRFPVQWADAPHFLRQP